MKAKGIMAKTATRIISFRQRQLEAFEGSLDEMKAAGKKDSSAEDLRLAVTALEMRLAVLSARMAAPKKGDRPELLQAEYLEIAEQLREMKRR